MQSAPNLLYSDEDESNMRLISGIWHAMSRQGRQALSLRLVRQLAHLVLHDLEQLLEGFLLVSGHLEYGSQQTQTDRSVSL